MNFLYRTLLSLTSVDVGPRDDEEGLPEPGEVPAAAGVARERLKVIFNYLLP